MILYDTDYALLVLNGRELGFIVTRGMVKTMAGEVYRDADIKGRLASSTGNIVKVEGYTTSYDVKGNRVTLEEWDKTQTEKFAGLDFKYMVFTVEESGGTFYLRNYEI